MIRESAKRVIGQMEAATRQPRTEIGAYLTPLYLLALQSKAPVVELGVGGGFSTLALFLGASDAGVRLSSYDIDGDSAHRALAKIEGHPKADSWSFTQAKASDGAKDFEPGSVGLLFVDSSHDYKDTVEELEAWLPKMCTDGIICGHDYYLHLPRADGTRPDPPWNGRLDGVFRAVNEFAKRYENRFELQVVGPYDFGFFIFWPK